MSGKSNRCVKCNKIVGFAEAVHRDEKVFHRDCYRCQSCGKKLQRGQGLTHKGDNYCHNCHAKQFGPMGFKPGVLVNKKAMARVSMQMQPPFAHVSVDLRKDKGALQKLLAAAANSAATAANSAASSDSHKNNKNKEENKKLHHFDVAVFTGKTEGELRSFLEEGKVDCSGWDKGALKELLSQLSEGKSELGLDTDGHALRVASVVKALVYDEDHDAVLFNPLNSFEDEKKKDELKGASYLTDDNDFDESFGDMNQNTYPSVLDQLKFRMDHVPQPMHDFIYPGVYEDLGFNNVAASGLMNQLVGGGKVEIPGALVLETTFCTLKETPYQAGARLFTGRFSMKHATPKIFSKVVHKQVKTHLSGRFEGLNSEYHIHYLLLRKQLVAPLQKSLPLDKVTPVQLKKATKSGMNVNWYLWLKRTFNNETQLLTELETKYKSDSKVTKLVGDVDFKGPLALEMGKVMIDEMKALDLWQTK